MQIIKIAINWRRFLEVLELTMILLTLNICLQRVLLQISTKLCRNAKTDTEVMEGIEAGQKPSEEFEIVNSYVLYYK